MCIPGLHISLGVFKKFYDHLENNCVELDKKIRLQLANDMTYNGSDDSITLLKEAMSREAKAEELREEVQTLQERVTLLAMHTDTDMSKDTSAKELIENISRITKLADKEVRAMYIIMIFHHHQVKQSSDTN